MTEQVREYGMTDELVREVAANMAESSVSAVETRLVAGMAHMHIRRRGAMITSLALDTGRADGRPVEILYAGDDHTAPQLQASHAMMPVGHNTGPGGWHGIPRWLDYYPARTDGHEPPAVGQATGLRQPSMTNSMAAVTGRTPLAIERRHVLTSRKAQMTTWLHNGGSEMLATSLGEHLYLAAPSGVTAHDITINGQTIDKLTEPGVAADIARGVPYFWDGYTGEAIVEVPGAYKIRLDASLRTHPSHLESAPPIGMVLWQCPAGQDADGTPLHQPSICLEPTAGYSETDNRQLRVLPGVGTAALSTTLTALA